MRKQHFFHARQTAAHLLSVGIEGCSFLPSLTLCLTQWKAAMQTARHVWKRTILLVCPLSLSFLHDGRLSPALGLFMRYHGLLLDDRKP